MKCVEKMLFFCNSLTNLQITPLFEKKRVAKFEILWNSFVSENEPLEENISYENDIIPALLKNRMF
jgi:hypothetical protein